MTRVTTVGAALAGVFALLLFAYFAGSPGEPDAGATATAPGARQPSTHDSANAALDVDPGFIYGRVLTAAGAAYEGRLRWGGDQEAFWADYFNGTKSENPWESFAPASGRPLEIFGFRFGRQDLNLERPFMVRFGDLARIDAHLSTTVVTLKSGTAITLNRFEAGDIDDGVRVWDREHGVVDLDSRQIRTIEFLPATAPSRPSDRLHGTVRTARGGFSGFIQWNRQDGLGSDVLHGRSPQGDVHLRYDSIQSIERRSRNSALVTLRDGRDVILADTSEVGRGNRGIYVDDVRYGRVLISWEVFERVDFGPGGPSPGYDDFLPGRPLSGFVLTRDGPSLAGRIVYDFDESETTDTLDAALEGVDFTLPFGLVATILPRGAEGGASRPTVFLQTGEELQLEPTGGLAPGNAGVLIFAEDSERPEFVPWTDVARIDFDR